MSRPFARLFSSSTRSSALLSTTSCSTSSAKPAPSLPAIRYHIFKEPLPYPVGLKLQNDIIDVRLEAKKKDPVGSKGLGDVLLLLEHTPTYTTGRRDNSPNPNELHPEEKKVQNVGASFFITKRGGQVTYHGPGQLVGYSIMDLNVMETPTRCYVEYMQAMLGDYVRDASRLDDIYAPHPDGHVGVFSSPTEKIASIGIHLRHRITSHGFSLNITPEPISWFDLVVACGLDDVRATSLHELIKRAPLSEGNIPACLPSVQGAAKKIVPRFAEMFGRNVEVLGREGEEGEAGKIWELVKEAEQQAREENAKNGGWASEPDLNRR
ncbi:lipoyl(octanoyl) transferase [Cryptococcus floricola]|uniref:lipoyl(octanoyl) transferase n=1 Tax=Cryptococcus floricola TaxID=2591691 RepID=A0A5D3ATR0_9TREE|nr:lipoyl(octanoyl) transferase [Cryptococcus floricola]